jgi:hypothetical protein
MARQIWLSLLIGAAFVGLLLLLGHHNLATPVPFLLLFPGLLAGSSMPGSGFELKDDHPWSVPATLVFCAVDVALYGALANLLLYRGASILLSRKRRSA